MKVFVGCSSYNDIDNKYFIEAQNVADLLIKNKCDLMMGCCSRGLMGVITNKYSTSSLNQTNICIEYYKDDIKDVPGNNILVKNINTQLKMFMNNDYLIYLPGGYGTLNEIFYMINAYVIEEHNAKIIIVNTTHYFDGVKDMIDKIKKEKFAQKYDFVKFIDSLDELDEILKEG